ERPVPDARRTGSGRRGDTTVGDGLQPVPEEHPRGRSLPNWSRTEFGEEKQPMFITKMHLSRRTMLRGLGAALALPVLDSMVPAMSALANTAAAPVKRLGVFYVPNGMSMPYWFPKTEGP